MSFLLAGCESLALLKEKFSPSQTIATTKVAQAWQAELPHGGDLNQLQNFWRQYEDDLLLALIEEAQARATSIASASAKIVEARANRVASNAALLPKLDTTFSSARAVQQPAISIDGAGTQAGGVGFGAFGNQVIETTQANAQASWELDLFGGNTALLKAAKAREDAAQAGWHDARVSVAAEVATAYFNQRFCQMQLTVSSNDAKSRAATARLTEISAKAGFTANANLQLANAGAADAAQAVKAVQAQCDSSIKELVALTEFDEAKLRQELAEKPFKVTENQVLFNIDEVPAKVIAQRPDIYSAEADLMSAAAEVKNTQVQRLPKITLNGSIGWMRLVGSGFSGQGEVWSLGPVSITLPIFDGGRRKANVESAQAKYEESAVIYRSKVRNAVKEVEVALVSLHSTQNRQAEIKSAIEWYEASLNATQEKVKAGFANLIELEENRRYALQAHTNYINLQKERNNAWIALYRAAGGGWQATSQLAGQSEMKHENSTNETVEK